MKNIVTIQFGSHLYGTNTPESDFDFKAVHIPPAREILLQRVQDSVSTMRPKAEGEKNQVGEIDKESYSLQKYLQLLADGQTVAIDMLFAPKSSIIDIDPLWLLIYSNRHRFLSKKSTAFVGYCRTQANKYGIKGSRVAAARNAAEFFEVGLDRFGPTCKVGAFERALADLTDDHTSIVTEEIRPGVFQTFFECCNRKVDFTATIKMAHEIFSRIHSNYGSRAQLAEQNEGIDWKALSHAVRVGREALELLNTGRINFPLSYAPRLLDIKKGRVVYQEVAEEIEGLLVEVEKAAQASTLPDQPDREFMDDLVKDVYQEAVRYVLSPPNPWLSIPRSPAHI